MVRESKSVWYSAGLHFGCAACGNCCAGPGEGFIWVTEPEIKFIADYLKITEDSLCRNYLRQMGLRFSIREQPANKDCIFLQKTGTGKQCAIYPVRPNQCRKWPFWPENLYSPDSWNEAARRCPGINRGRFYSCDEIEKILTSEKWWTDAAKPTAIK
jgi:Fe-S-cluster containining protein